MKLTTARLKKLIREEIEKLNEAVSPKSFVKSGTIKFPVELKDPEDENSKIVPAKNAKTYQYYVFVVGQKGLKNLASIKTKAGHSDNPLGHKRVKDRLSDKLSLWNTIKDEYESKAGKLKSKHMFVVGTDNENFADIKNEVI